jgi:hypothetical protein
MKTTYTNIFRSIITCTIVVLLAVMPFMPNRALSDDTQTNDDRPTVALVNRVVEIVERRAPAIDWRQAKIGDLLNSGDMIKTGPASFSLVRFYDNSLLRIRELSEVTVFADRDREAYHRNIQIERGTVSFDVRKQESDRFEFSTPTSVASIRGSSGILSVEPENPTVLLMVTGFAILRNLLSGEEVNVTGGQIAFSFPDGGIQIRDITEDDLDQYGDVTDETGKDIERQRRTLEIRTTDEDGNPRRLIIEFEEDKKDQ